MAGRFSFSAPESRFGGRPWFRLGQLDVTTTVLVVLMCVASMFVWAIDTDSLEPLLLLPDNVLDGEIWRVVTWPIPTEPTLWTVITLAIFWYFGREIEGLMGRNRFAWFLLAVTVVPGLVGVGLDLAQAGIRSVEFAVFLVFILEYPFARFFFGIPAWVIGAVFVGIEVLQLAGLRDGDSIIFLFVSLATAAVTARTFGLAASLPWIPRLPIGPGHSSGRSRSRRSRPKPPRRQRGGSRVVEGPWGSAPPAPPGGAASGDPSAVQMELDDLLDKINAGGINSLTSAEKRRLNELSKRLR